MNKGWQCPGCDKCYAPHVSECNRCGDSLPKPYPFPPSPWPVDPYVPYKWVYTPECVCRLKNGFTGVWCTVHDTTVTITSDSTFKCAGDSCVGCIEYTVNTDHE